MGGGISGLAAAYRIRQQNPGCRIVILEAGERCGGVIGTEDVDGFCIEQGPDSILNSLPWGTGLCQSLGVAEQLIGTNQQKKQTWIMRSGRLLALPDGLAIMAPRRIWPTVKSPILSVSAKARMACERFISKRLDTTDESLATFACRRFGREAFERLIQPLVSGIYMADSEKLSMQAALPRFVDMETQHGSLIRAARQHAKSSSADKGMFVAPFGGLGSLINALVEQLPPEAVRLRTPIYGIRRAETGGWRLSMPDGSTQRFDGVVLATPSDVTARLLSGLNPEVARELAAIDRSGCIVVSLAYPRDAIGHPLDGHGFVVPQVEQREIIASTFSSVKYAGRAPDGFVLLRVFLGGATRQHAMSWDDTDVVNVVLRELNPLLKTTQRPRFVRVIRHEDVMPQYHVGHLDRMSRVDSQLEALPGIELAGNSYRGVGIPHCIHSGQQAADRVLSFIRTLELSSANAQVAL